LIAYARNLVSDFLLVDVDVLVYWLICDECLNLLLFGYVALSVALIFLLLSSEV
jgi:hypothetical protein